MCLNNSISNNNNKKKNFVGDYKVDNWKIKIGHEKHLIVSNSN